jgi:hypothetical protein
MELVKPSGNSLSSAEEYLYTCISGAVGSILRWRHLVPLAIQWVMVCMALSVLITERFDDGHLHDGTAGYGGADHVRAESCRVKLQDRRGLSR